MTGPEHYLAAERLAAGRPLSAEDIEDGIGPASGLWPPSEIELRRAQVHATLALAAATALKDPESAGFYKVDRLEWEKAASLYEPPEADR